MDGTDRRMSFLGGQIASPEKNAFRSAMHGAYGHRYLPANRLQDGENLGGGELGYTPIRFTGLPGKEVASGTSFLQVADATNKSSFNLYTLCNLIPADIYLTASPPLDKDRIKTTTKPSLETSPLYTFINTKPTFIMKSFNILEVGIRSAQL